MRLRRLSLRGVTRFADPVEVDFDALGEGLIAIAGRNGEGKTTLLEAPFAALHLEMPTRPGGLYAVAHGRDARIELEVENNAPYRCAVAVDAVRQSSEAYLFNGDGQPVTSGKVREYAAAIAERFGSPRLMLSAALSCQTKRGSFLDLSKAERKDLLSEILDTAGLQTLAEAARAHVRADEMHLERLRGQATAAEVELARLDGAAVDVDELRSRHAAAVEAVTQAEAALEEARGKVAELERQAAVARETEASRARLERQVQDIGGELARLEAQRSGIDTERTRLERQIAEGKRAARTEVERIEEYADADMRRTAALELRSTLASQVRERQDELEKARGALQSWRDDVAPLGRLRAELAAAKAQASMIDDGRCAGTARWAPLEERDDVGLPSLNHIAGPVSLRSECKLLAASRSASDLVPRLEAEIELHADSEPMVTAAMKAVDVAEQAVRDAMVDLEAAVSEAAKLEPFVRRLADARAAEQRIANFDRQFADGNASLDRRLGEIVSARRAKQIQLAGVQVEIEAMAGSDLKQVTSKLEEWVAERGWRAAGLAGRQSVERDLSSRIVRAEEQARRRGEVAEQLEQAKSAAAMLAGEIGEWTTLERALGRDGIQALEIDAAGPELSVLTNELLTECFGPRFELRFQTQALKADGKGSKEVFDVQVVDHDRGREGAVDSLSGGEKTIVSEAISLALAIYVGRHSGRRFQTLFRDETAGQLDPDNAQRYVAMLRRARLMAGAHQVVFIAQQPEVWQQADAVLYVQDGRVEVRR